MRAPGGRPARARPAAVLVLVLCAAACAGPGGPAPASATSARAATSTPRVVALGDSVPAGDGCGCTAFPALVAAELPPDGGADLVQRAVGGATTQDVTAEVRGVQDEGAAGDGRALGAGDVVLLMAGANDLVAAGDPGPGDPVARQALVAPVVEAVAGAVEDLSASGARVVVLDYWAVGVDGDVARVTSTPAERRAWAALTDAFDDGLAAAVGDRALFVELRPVFHGEDGTTDPTPLLAADGDHPNAAGHRAIADAVLAALARSTSAAGSPGVR